MKPAIITVRVSELPQYKRLYQAVHAYLLEGLLNKPWAERHEAYCELVAAHDAIAESRDD